MDKSTGYAAAEINCSTLSDPNLGIWRQGVSTLLNVNQKRLQGCKEYIQRLKSLKMFVSMNFTPRDTERSFIGMLPTCPHCPSLSPQSRSAHGGRRSSSWAIHLPPWSCISSRLESGARRWSQGLHGGTKSSLITKLNAHFFQTSIIFKKYNSNVRIILIKNYKVDYDK